MTGCVDFDASMSIRYESICETNAESQKFEIAKISVKISELRKNDLHDIKVGCRLSTEY